VSVIKDVVSMLEQLAKQALGLSGPGAGLGGVFQAIFGALFSAGGPGGIVGGAAVPIPTPPLAHLQGGGMLGGGDWAVVGEHGPELIQANQPATVYPSGMLGGMGSGGGASLHVNINAPGADPYQLQQVVIAVRELHTSLEPRAIAAVDRGRKRGGQLARTFGR
jgi:hypothetical protein